MKQKISLLILILSITACGSSGSEPANSTDPVVNPPEEVEEKTPVAEGYYRNPITIDQEETYLGKIGGGVADPMVFRWMGKYYLMTTQFYTTPSLGFKVWESDDLVDWKFKKYVAIEGMEWNVMWSPEMYYYRGNFYIYFSGPDGKVAAMKYEISNNASNSAPFTDEANWQMISHDFFQLPDHSIDGSILIEANGDKFAFFSGLHGVKYRKINSMEDGTGGPVTQIPEASVENIYIGSGIGTKGWTEAPTAFKKDGKYYLTYTGNHFLRPDYQIHLAVGTSLQDFTPIDNNPLISNLSGDWTGPGNSYPVLAPNLTDYYFSYHAKAGELISVDSVQRKLMIDKVTFNADGITTKAPTFDDEIIPAQANFSESFDVGLADFIQEGEATWTALAPLTIGVTAPEAWEHRIYSKENTGDNFVVEANMRMVDFPVNGFPKVAFIHGEQGQEPNLLVGLDAFDGISKLVVFDKKNQWQSIELPEFDVKDWTDIRVEKKADELIVHVSNIEVLRKPIDNFKGAKVGYLAESCNAEVSWLSFANID
ncbi:MAG: family 43 glycosylhydrolase [Colwellia sp.]